MGTKKKGTAAFKSYRGQLLLLSGFFQRKAEAKLPLKAFELDMRVARVLKGYKEVGMTTEELEALEKYKVELFKRYGRKTKK